MIRHVSIVLAVVALLASATAAQATITAAWTAPPDGTAYLAGTCIAPTGQASASGTVGGTGLDLVFVLDSSGSMGTSVDGKTRQQWQQEAAKALVDVLPTATTSVSVVEFDSDANTVRQLLALEPAANIATIKSAIDSVDASGSTYIGTGINEALSELTSVRHTVGRAQMMVVTSDGASSGYPGGNADAAIAAGVDAIHSVGLPGHNVSTMQSIVDGVNNVYGDGDDHGVYTSVSDLTTLEGIFTGTSGSLVGLDHIDVTLPDGTFIGHHPVDGLGNFTLGCYTLGLGANVFEVDAYDSLGNYDHAELTLYGIPSQNTSTPEPASILIWSLVGLCLVGTRRW